MNFKDGFSGFKFKSNESKVLSDAKDIKSVHEPFFVQALLSPKRNDLFYIMDSCCEILSEKNILKLYEKILNESVKSLHAAQGAFYLYIKKDNFFELINYYGIPEEELLQWAEFNNSVKSELNINKNTFYNISNSKEIDLNSILIPIQYKGKLYAVIKLSEREELQKFTKYDLNIANQMSDFVDIAIENLKAPAKVVKDKKASLRLHEKRTFKLNYFYEFLSNELRRARRYKKTFSLVYFKIENFDEIKAKFGEKLITGFINAILDNLNLTIRETDFIAEESESKYFVVLTETDYFGSLMTMRKIDTNIAHILPLKEGKESLEASVKMSSASFPKDGTNAKSILKALSIRMEIAKNSITDKLDLKQASFWKLLSDLIGNEEDYTKEAIGNKKLVLPNISENAQEEKGTIKFSVFHPQIIRQLENILLHEISINPEQKGIIYFGNSTIDHTFSLLKKLSDLEYSKSRISLITKQCEKEVLFPNITYIFTSDDIILNYYFVIYLNERYAYGLIAKKNSQGAYYGFHTSDSIFVENLIVKLQNHYMLQEQL